MGIGLFSNFNHFYRKVYICANKRRGKKCFVLSRVSDKIYKNIDIVYCVVLRLMGIGLLGNP